MLHRNAISTGRDMWSWREMNLNRLNSQRAVSRNRAPNNNNNSSSSSPPTTPLLNHFHLSLKKCSPPILPTTLYLVHLNHSNHTRAYEEYLPALPLLIHSGGFSVCVRYTRRRVSSRSWLLLLHIIIHNKQVNNLPPPEKERHSNGLGNSLLLPETSQVCFIQTPERPPPVCGHSNGRWFDQD